MKKKKVAKRAVARSSPRKMSTYDLCLSLSCIAAFNLDGPKAQAQIYEAIRRLQALDAAAIEAGIIPKPPAKL